MGIFNFWKTKPVDEPIRKSAGDSFLLEMVRTGELNPIAFENQNGIITPRITGQTLLDYYYQNAWHGRCINVNALNILGNGISDNETYDRINALATGRNGHLETGFTLLHKTILDLLIHGHAHWEISRINDNYDSQINGLYHLPAEYMLPYKDDPKKPAEEQIVYVLKRPNDDKVINYKTHEIFTFRMYSPGCDEITIPYYIQNVMGMQINTSINQYNKSFFDNDCLPPAILHYEGCEPDKEMQNAIKNMFNKRKGAKNAGRALWTSTPDGTKLNVTMLKYEKEGSYLQLRQDYIYEIVMSHGVPPKLVGIAEAGKLGTGDIEGQIEIWQKFTIDPFQKLIGAYLDQFNQREYQKTTDISFIPPEWKKLKNGAEMASAIMKGIMR